MRDHKPDMLFFESFADQPADIKGLIESERDRLIITTMQLDGNWTVTSRYGDDTWEFSDFTTNAPHSSKKINFMKFPPAFRSVMKAMVYRLIMRGRNGCVRPKGPTVRLFFLNAGLFLRYLQSLSIESLGKISPMICANYAKSCKDRRHHQTGKPLSVARLIALLISVEEIYELSQYTNDPMPQHPWPESSARCLAGGIGMDFKSKTPLIPDDVFCSLFKQASLEIENAKQILDLRDELYAFEDNQVDCIPSSECLAKNRHLKSRGWELGLREFYKSLISLRTACYIVLASTSGCRNHELTNLQIGSHHRSEDNEGNIYHWMRSKSEKTDEGMHSWMIPEAAVRALRVMERWSDPYRAAIADEIAHLRRYNPHDPNIGEVLKHRNALFLGLNKFGKVRTVTRSNWPKALNNFTKNCGLNWKLATHQFRRKFANYAAHSRFGDLRYLREHFAHWSLDMTLRYAMDDSWGQHLDLDLYLEIQGELEDIKFETVDSWMESKSLAGGYGTAIKKWQRNPQNLLIFPNHAAMLKSIAESTSIRSNGHAWCTADNDRCVGNTLERTRCGAGCNQAVIGPSHAPIYQRLYKDLKELRDCADIGEAGRQRVDRDLDRSREVLRQLGIDPEEIIA
ncbi:conserved protein of unknown function [Pseudomonas sp. JV551A1]|uniref:Tyr recombinase domain-containing protein n=2 Tax=Pseudomonas TaxID=286 RepID=A0AAQ1P9X1_9PSED|nr:conserved protein of unknown function [Pseudomonas sp. JV551A1]SPO60440.1 conserved protein of unknown function [Pseudomonas inefficax]